MNLKHRIKKIEKMAESLIGANFAQMSDTELEEISAMYDRRFPERAARSKSFFQSLSDAELEAILNNNLGAVSVKTRRGYNELIKI